MAAQPPPRQPSLCGAQGNAAVRTCTFTNCKLRALGGARWVSRLEPRHCAF